MTAPVHPAHPGHVCACEPPCSGNTAVDISFVEEAVARLGRKSDALIPLLQALQNHYRYLPDEALRRLCELTEIRPAQLIGVATFYNQFRRRPRGLQLISVCHGTACHVKGAENVQAAFQRQLGISGEEDTDAQGRYTIQKVACLGCCTLAPVVQIDEITYGHVTPNMVAEVLRDDLAYRQRVLSQPKPGRQRKKRERQAEIRVGLGSCCMAKRSHEVKAAFAAALSANGIAARVKTVGCVCACYQTPLVEIVEPGQKPVLYARVQPQDVEAIVKRHFKAEGLLEQIRRLCADAFEKLLTDEAWPGIEDKQLDADNFMRAPFQAPQKRLATEHAGALNPLDFDEYARLDGFRALRCALHEWEPERIITEIQRSGLRGRGGAGFPTGDKWQKVRAKTAQPKYVICNGDEGDPGAFMDRMLLESFPFRILEGMAIAARAVGAGEGILYIRAEYPLAVERIRAALQQCERAGLLGERMDGSGFSLRLRVFEGAGAFVCGEETALLESIEGRRGVPRPRPPFPARSGLFGRPTLINNVETYALVPWIIRHGAAAFAALGTPRSSGTKVFALAGKVARGGLIEVPMGMTIRQIVEEIGGGVADGKRFKAVQIGGPSGGCVPASLADTPVDYEALAEVGAMMGSGGLVVLDDSDCMVEMARYFLQFTQNESCGRCTFCRIGTRRMLDILEALCAGKGSGKDLAELEHLAKLVQQGSLCGLGRTAPNPVLSTLKYFREEYEAHVAGRCPVGRCKALIHYTITDACIGCTRCAQNCPVGAIPPTPYQKHVIDDKLCTRCDTCRQGCPEKAIKVE